MIKTKALILTGCAGFIGVNFLKLLTSTELARDYNFFISIDKMGYATQFNIMEYYKACDYFEFFYPRTPKMYVIEANINSSFKLNSFFNWEADEYDVVDFASESHVDRSIANPYAIFSENSSIPANLIAALGLEKIKKYVHISTDEVYGDLPLDTKPKNWFDITSPLHPNNPYSASKAAQDCFLMSLKHTFKLNVKFIRLANQFGSHQHPEKMLPATIKRAVNGEPIKIYGSGLNMRQWTPVKESVKIILDVLLGKINDDLTHIAFVENKIPNNNEVVEIWRKILKDSHNIDTKVEYIEDRKGHDLLYALKTTPLVNSYFKQSQESYFKEAIDFYVKQNRSK